MIESFWKFYKSAIDNNVPIESIALFVFMGVVAFGSYRIVKYMMSSKKEILDQSEIVSSALVEVSSHLSSMSVGIQESVGILTNMNFRLDTMTKPDERIVESQAQIIYSLLMQELFDSIKENYFNIRDWIDSKDLDMSEDRNINNVSERCTLIFDSNLKALEEKMNNFSFNDKSLSVYLNADFRSEYNHLKSHIYSLLITKENGIRTYLEQKKEFFKSDFNSWLRGV